jgi:hypothetical protein
MFVILKIFKVALPLLYIATSWLYGRAFFKDDLFAKKYKTKFLVFTLVFHFVYLILRTAELNHPPVTSVFELLCVLGFDPKVKEIENVFLEDIDSLESIARSNYERRLNEIPKVQRIIDEEMKNFIKWYETHLVAPTIKLLREKFEEIRRSELEKYKNKFSPEDFQKVDALTKTLVNKLLHTPTVSIRESSNGKSDSERIKFIQFVRELFGLGQ